MDKKLTMYGVNPMVLHLTGVSLLEETCFKVHTDSYYFARPWVSSTSFVKIFNSEAYASESIFLIQIKSQNNLVSDCSEALFFLGFCQILQGFFGSSVHESCIKWCIFIYRMKEISKENCLVHKNRRIVANILSVNASKAGNVKRIV